ncbi:molybdenum cofactor biosynthesis protein B [Halomicrobium zhouii]|uniref:Molybdenum cofactor biosynthesis protein B n=1 Tax=Halomicrobium zhouii TaxID=767519 RepID=A0A1I6KPB6_9EURY|nr:molybdenum cofactor synthesis domain-containing protein [Halomicrobium zhouii]SFR93027.1 molybdenum cofactor biosynthesis protein B [Halomicrobium zhouii]
MVDFQSRDTNRGRSTSDDDVSVDGQGDVDPDEPDSSEDPAAATADHEETTVISAAVVSVSDTRTHDDDPGGEAVVDAFEAAGHDVVTREVLRTAHDSVQQTVDTLVRREDVTVVVTTGGTGVGPRAVTIDAVHPLIDKGLPGFGELFRRRYAESVGTDAIGTRATAGIAEATPVFCLPGDPDAARLGVSEIVVEQAERLATLASGDDTSDA